MSNEVYHPKHYTSHPSGIETIELTANQSFLVGNAIKYLARYNLKGTPEQDLRKAIFYIERAIEQHVDRDEVSQKNMPWAYEPLVIKWMKAEKNPFVASAVGSLCSYRAGLSRLPLEVAFVATLSLLLEETENER